MPTPSEYKPTTNNPKFRTFSASKGYYDSQGKLMYEFSEDKFLDYAKNGNSYIGPMFGVPNGWYYSPNYYDKHSQNGDLDKIIYFWKNLEPGKRCIGFNFANGGAQTLHSKDNLNPDLVGITGLGFTYWSYLDTYGTTTVYGYPNFRPENGITLTRNFWDSCIGYIKNQGATVDAVVMAQEGNRFSDYFGKVRQFVSGQTEAYQSWHGLTALMNIFAEQTHPAHFPGSAWGMATNAYVHKAMDLTYSEPYFSRYPNGVMSNYASWNSDRYGNANSGFEDGIFSPGQLGNVGNAPGPSLYAMIRLFDRETIPNSSEIHYLDPYTGGGSTREHTLDQYTTTGAWKSFFIAVSEMRMVKRNAPNNPIIPWIANVSLSNAEYNIWNLSRELPNNQAPAEVLHETWYRKNMHNVVIGFGGYVGFTATTPGYYGAIPGFLAPDGSTTAIKLDTKTTLFNVAAQENVKCELRYYYNGLSAGSTYIFSYYVDLNKGYTALNANFTTYDQPNRPNGFTGMYAGITFIQTLPSLTGPFNGETPIYFSEGNSGWTKVEWKFNAPPNNTTLNAYLYSVNNPSGSSAGRETFIWNIKFEKEASPSNIDIPVVPPYHETERVWRHGPPIGVCDVKKGYNPKQAAYFTKRGGNSGYYYEMIRHLCLQGSKGFGYFNATTFIDHGVTGTISVGLLGEWTFAGGKNSAYFASGRTGYLTEYKHLDDCLKDVHDKVGGFTYATALTGYINWRLPYVANGMPDVTGNTWWWRVTVKPGFTMNCHGITLYAPDKLGTWVPLNSSDEGILADGITWQEWPRHRDWPAHNTSEPNLPTPTKEFNFLGMTSTSSLTAEGFIFTRGGSATYIGSDGYVKIAGPNQARFTHDADTKQPKGLLLEPYSSNELCWSEIFGFTGGSANNWEDFNLVRSYGFTSPAGLTNAIRFTANTDGGFIRSDTARPFGKRSFSIWLRGITGNEKVFFTIDGGTYWHPINYVTNNWKRFDFTYQYPFSDAPYFYGLTYANHQVGIKIKKQGQQIELWGAQLEPQRDFTLAYRGVNEVSTSYIPTAGTTSARLGEICRMSGNSLTNWLGATYGTMIFDTEEHPEPSFYQDNNYWGNLMYLGWGGHNFAFYFWGKDVVGLAPGNAFPSVPYPYTNGIFPTGFPVKTLLTYSPDGLTHTQITNQASLGWSADSPNKALATFNTFQLSGYDSTPIPPYAGFGRYRKFRYWNTVLNDATCKEIGKSANQDPYLNIWNPYDTDWKD